LEFHFRTAQREGNPTLRVGFAALPHTSYAHLARGTNTGICATGHVRGQRALADYSKVLGERTPVPLLGTFDRFFAWRTKRTGAPALALRSHHDPAEHEHGPVEEWFIRTARILLGSRKNSAAAGTPKPSPFQQRIEVLEAENALLRADYHRLAEEVVALRTLVYVRHQNGGG
jgi:hypothetical protein